MAFASLLNRLLRVNAAAPYSLTLPTADGPGPLMSDGAGTLSFGHLFLPVEGRLTLTSGTAATSADVSAAATAYYTPYLGHRIALYSGTVWKLYTFTEIAIALGALTASTPYDVFAYDNAGVVAIETLAWATATARATALTLQDGRLVKTGATTRLYLGSIYINASGGQTDDTAAKRSVFNCYNRLTVDLRRQETASTWSQTASIAYRQANSNAANQVEVMVGLAEEDLFLQLLVWSSTNNNTPATAVNIGEDSTTTPATKAIASRVSAPSTNYYVTNSAVLSLMPAIGRHVYTWLEYSNASGANVTTWGGTDGGGAPAAVTGLAGRWRR